jgi:hypothetical protein
MLLLAFRLTSIDRKIHPLEVKLERLLALDETVNIRQSDTYSKFSSTIESNLQIVPLFIVIVVIRSINFQAFHLRWNYLETKCQLDHYDMSSSSLTSTAKKRSGRNLASL